MIFPLQGVLLSEFVKNNRGLHSHLLPKNLNLNYENLFVFECKSTAFF